MHRARRSLISVTDVPLAGSGHTRSGMEVVTRYARSGDVQIAYQLAGHGPLDVLVVPRWFSNIELDWDLPPSARFITRLASFARLIQF